jgi:signal transduction histidine kinase
VSPVAVGSRRGRDRVFGSLAQPGSLARRLLISYLIVVLVDVTVFVSTGLYMSPSRVSTAQTGSAYQRALVDNQLEAVFIGALISLAVASVAAAMITRRVLDPVRRLRLSAQKLREGDYGGKVEVPHAPELVDLATDLNLLAARLGDVETRRARLVSDLAHELRTPLTIIDGQLAGVRDGVYDLTPELITSVREELDRLRRLTDDLSGLSRAEENAYDLHPQDTDVAALIGHVAERLRYQFDHAHVGLRTSSPGPTRAEIDAERISQILTNLLRNALAATPPDGEVAVVLHRTPSAVTIEITDTGRGIAVTDLERIFERFERVVPTREHRDGAGSGIGLTIARSLARAHGGDLNATSAGVGLGARFTLCLPVTTPRGTAVPALGFHDGAQR